MTVLICRKWLNTGNELFQNQQSQDLILKPALLNQHTAIYHDTADLNNKIRLLDTGEMIQLAWEKCSQLTILAVK